MVAGAQPRRVLHLANHNSNNIGNGALILGLERVLREDVGDHLAFVHEPWDAYTLGDTRHFDGQFVDLVNRHDLLLVGGAVMMNGMRRYTETGTRLDVPAALWRRIRTPILFYSVATNILARQPYFNRDRLKRFLEERIIGAPNVLFAVRNDGTKGWLESILGHPSDAIIEVPDPALYVPAVATDHPELHASRPNVVLALNTEAEVYRFGGRYPDRVWRYLPGWKRRKRKFLRAVAAALDRLAASHDANVILCPHCPSDFKMIAELLAHCSTLVSAYAVVSAGLPRATEAARFYDLYRRADLAVSMRIHSMTCALGLGTPTLALAGARRVRYSMRDLNLEDLIVPVLASDLADRLYERMVWALNHRAELRERIAGGLVRMRERTASFNRRVANFMEERRG